MFYLSLPFAVFVLVIALFAARREPHPVRWRLFILAGLPAALMSGSVVVLGMFGLLFVALIVWQFARSRVRVFLPLAVVAAAFPYSWVGWEAAKEEARQERLRAEYSFESFADRLPEPREGLRAPLNADAATRLDGFERIVLAEGSQSPRTYHLRALHNRSVHTFVNNPGFGVMRMRSDRISETRLKEHEQVETPGQPGSPPGVWHEPFEPTTNAEREAIGGLHADGLLDFVNPAGWGYVRSRREVSGFLSHRFSKVPEAKTWRVQRIELVGLLKHPQPVVYLSDKLPAMAELRDAQTRPPDDFESAGLKEIRTGEDGFAARRDDEVRFVGAIRSAKQCLDCHGGQRGDLLGAFSYTLRPSGNDRAK